MIDGTLAEVRSDVEKARGDELAFARELLERAGIPPRDYLPAMVEALKDGFESRGIILDHIAETLGMPGANHATLAQELRRRYPIAVASTLGDVRKAIL